MPLFVRPALDLDGVVAARLDALEQLVARCNRGGAHEVEAGRDAAGGVVQGHEAPGAEAAVERLDHPHREGAGDQDRKSTRLNPRHSCASSMQTSACNNK